MNGDQSDWDAVEWRLLTDKLLINESTYRDTAILQKQRRWKIIFIMVGRWVTIHVSKPKKISTYSKISIISREHAYHPSPCSSPFPSKTWNICVTLYSLFVKCRPDDKIILNQKKWFFPPAQRPKGNVSLTQVSNPTEKILARNERKTGQRGMGSGNKKRREDFFLEFFA